MLYVKWSLWYYTVRHLKRFLVFYKFAEMIRLNIQYKFLTLSHFNVQIRRNHSMYVGQFRPAVVLCWVVFDLRWGSIRRWLVSTFSRPTLSISTFSRLMLRRSTFSRLSFCRCIVNACQINLSGFSFSTRLSCSKSSNPLGAVYLTSSSPLACHTNLIKNCNYNVK